LQEANSSRVTAQITLLLQRAAGSFSTPYHRVQALLADIVEIVVAVLLPPLGVFLATGFSTDLLINILLTLL